METTKLMLKSIPSLRMKVIKVVNLKRFMPVSPPLRSERRNSNSSSINNLDTVTKESPHSIKKKHTPNQTISASYINKEDHRNAGDEEVIANNLSNFLDLTENNFINNSRNKIQFKSCLHTAEDLINLTEHCERTLVKVGDIFDCRESFRQYLNDNAKRWHYYYVCRNSKKRIIEYNCICMAYSLKPKEVIIRRRKKRITACPCKIRLTVDERTKKVIVYYVCNHHDHALTEAAFYHYPHIKYFPQHVKDEFLDLTYLGLDIDLIQKYILSLVGLTIKRKDIWSYAYKFKRKIYERRLTAERKIYMKELISRIRETFEQPYDIVSDTYLDDESEIAARDKLSKTDNTTQRKVSSIIEKEKTTLVDTTTINDDLRRNDSEFENPSLDVLSVSNAVDRNSNVIVHYIDENGILCDENGSPVTNSSAIMQFIHNYEYVMPEINVKAEQFPEEGTVFSELVESIHDEVIPFDWDSIQEVEPTIERTCETYKESRVEDTTELVVFENEIDQELSVTATEIEQRTENIKSITVLNIAEENFHKSLSPTIESPALYAEIENFKKYYFVDHQYIKHGKDNCKNQENIESKQKLQTGVGPTILSDSTCEEYIKAPEFVNHPTYLKYCSGHEHLLQLPDADAIQAGAKFLKHDVFITYINERANRWFFYYSLVESGKSPEYYVYKCVYGKHRVSKNAYRAKGLRKRVKLTTQCPCQLRLRRLESAPEFLTVLYSCNHHDHALDEQRFTAQPHSRRLPEQIKEELKDLLSLGVSFEVLRKHVKSETGLQMYGKYFHNVRMKMRRDNEARQFTDERLKVLTKKIKDLEAIYGSKSKSLNKKNKRRRSAQTLLKEDRSTQAGSDEVATQTQDPPSSCVAKRSRLGPRLRAISSHEDTLLEESARCDVWAEENSSLQFHTEQNGGVSLNKREAYYIATE